MLVLIDSQKAISSDEALLVLGVFLLVVLAGALFFGGGVVFFGGGVFFGVGKVAFGSCADAVPSFDSHEG